MVETTTITQEQLELEQNNPSILKLRTANNNTETPQHQVRFTENTIDNENMNKKKTKICCIFHPEDEDTCHHDDEPEEKEDDGDVSSDEEDNALSYEQRRANRIERRKKQLEEQHKGAYLPANSYEIQPDYSAKKTTQ